MPLWENLVHPVNKRPLLIIQNGRLASQVARAEHQVILNVVAHLWPQCWPKLIAIIGNHKKRTRQRGHITSPHASRHVDPMEQQLGFPPASLQLAPSVVALDLLLLA